MGRTFFALGAVFAFLAVAAGAFGAHALKARLEPERLVQFELAARYQIYHAFALIAAAWAVEKFPGGASRASGWLFVIGILIFCGTVYGLAFGAPRWFGAITPIGGVSFLIGWLMLAIAAWR
ncbi:MAG: DUF423 domain-containing protein [Gemmatimonadota bacterium]